MHRFGDGPKDGSQNIIWKASLKKKSRKKDNVDYLKHLKLKELISRWSWLNVHVSWISAKYYFHVREEAEKMFF